MDQITDEERGRIAELVAGGRAAVEAAPGDQPVAACDPAGGGGVVPAGEAGAAAVGAEAVAGGAGGDLPGGCGG